jgi:hypothetical protein
MTLFVLDFALFHPATNAIIAAFELPHRVEPVATMAHHRGHGSLMQTFKKTVDVLKRSLVAGVGQQQTFLRSKSSDHLPSPVSAAHTQTLGSSVSCWYRSRSESYEQVRSQRPGICCNAITRAALCLFALAWFSPASSNARSSSRKYAV